jgi:hypothetical protein
MEEDGDKGATTDAFSHYFGLDKTGKVNVSNFTNPLNTTKHINLMQKTDSTRNGEKKVGFDLKSLQK